MLAVEFQSGLVPLEHSDARRAVQIFIDCADKNTAHVKVLNPTNGRQIERSVKIRRLPTLAQARLIALATVELVAIINTDPSKQAPSRRTETPPKKTNPAIRPWRLEAIGGATLVADPTVARFGVGVTASRSLFERLNLRWDVIAEYGVKDVSLGSASLFSISSALSTSVRFKLRSAVITTGIGGRIGAVQFTGTADEPGRVQEQSFWGFWAGPFAIATFHLPLSERWWLPFTSEIGYVTLPVGSLVGTDREAAIDGLWISLFTGLGLAI